jgi:hypothetical protein
MLLLQPCTLMEEEEEEEEENRRTFYTVNTLTDLFLKSQRVKRYFVNLHSKILYNIVESGAKYHQANKQANI